MDDNELKNAAHAIRCNVLRMTYLAGSGGAHVGGSLSVVEILTALYLKVMRFKKDNPAWPQRDRLILSKGHGAMALYAAMAQAGLLEEKELWEYKKDGTILTGHPSLHPERGLEVATGSLGQGLSYGTGICEGLKRNGNQESRVFVIQGDGECDEGSVWEAAACAAHYKLNNLVTIIDKNRLQYDGPTNEVLNMDDLGDKWRAFGWDTKEVDGHDCTAICVALMEPHKRPLALLANTVKGKGVSFMENDPHWHNSRLSEAQFRLAMEEQGVIDDRV